MKRAGMVKNARMMEGKRFTEQAFDSCPLACQVIPMGRDYTIAVYGGSLPHVGSVAMAQARPSLAGEGISATSSVINSVGHKDEAIARMFAEGFAIHGNCTAVCSCGIHMDGISPEQIKLVEEGCRRLLGQCLANFFGKIKKTT